MSSDPSAGTRPELREVAEDVAQYAADLTGALLTARSLGLQVYITLGVGETGVEPRIDVNVSTERMSMTLVVH